MTDASPAQARPATKAVRYHWVNRFPRRSGTAREITLYDVGIDSDGTLHNPNGYDETEVRASIEAAQAEDRARRSKAATKAAETRRQRKELAVYKEAQSLVIGDVRVVSPSRHCKVCGRGVSDPDSIERGIGSDCWQMVLEMVTVIRAGHIEETSWTDQKLSGDELRAVEAVIGYLRSYPYDDPAEDHAPDGGWDAGDWGDVLTAYAALGDDDPAIERDHGKVLQCLYCALWKIELPPMTDTDSDRARALMGPRKLKEPGSPDWCWQTVEFLNSYMRHVGEQWRQAKEVIEDLRSVRAWEKIPTDAPYGSLAELLEAETGLTQERIALLDEIAGT
jgi:hypothetical protein